MEINENKLKEILNEQRNEYQNFMKEQRQEFQHFMGILKEETNSQFQLMGEQFQGINNALETHAQMLGSIMEDVSIIKSDVQFLKVDLKKKVDYEEFNALVNRVSLLESKARK